MLRFNEPQMDTNTWCGHGGSVTNIEMITIIGFDNGLALIRRQTIIWTNDGILLISPQGINLSQIRIKIHIFSFIKMHLKMPSAKCRPFCLGLNVWNPHLQQSSSSAPSRQSLKWSQMNSEAMQRPEGHWKSPGGQSINEYRYIQCGAIITRSVFWKILIKDTPYLAR